jgi:6-methylsalicylate decarboxylase
MEFDGRKHDNDMRGSSEMVVGEAKAFRFSREGSARREFLTGFAALGAGALLGGKLLGQTKAVANPRSVDFQHHFTSPGWRAALSAKNLLPDVRKGWTPAKDIEEMDGAGCASAFICTGQAGWRLGDLSDKETIHLARDSNEYGAKMQTDYPGRYFLMAALPLPNIQASLDEIAYSLDTLKAAGFGLPASYDGHYIGEPEFVPVLEELNRRKAAVYVHPSQPKCCVNIVKGLAPNPIEYGTDTTRMIMSLIVSGAAAKYPDIRWIWAHGGGTMPFLIQRIAGAKVANNLDKPAAPNSKLYFLRKYYYDTGAQFNPVGISALKAVVGATQIVYGTDFPYGRMKETNMYLDEMPMKGVLTPRELQLLYRGNAVRLFPDLLKA